MRELLLVGKFNSYFHDLSRELESRFQVQACIDNADMMRDMIKLRSPDGIVLCMIGLGKEHNRIFAELQYNYRQIPVVCVGTDAERARFPEYMNGRQFKELERTSQCNGVAEAVVKLTGFREAVERSSSVQPEQKRKKSILLVDDNAIQLRTISNLLSDKYDVRLATSGMKAMMQIGKEVPDIIFLDYDMPVCDGKMTLQMIRESEEAKDVPVVFLTGVKDAAHIKAVMGLKPSGYILKPPKIERLEETIRGILGE